MCVNILSMRQHIDIECVSTDFMCLNILNSVNRFHVSQHIEYVSTYFMCLNRFHVCQHIPCVSTYFMCVNQSNVCQLI